MSNDSLLEKLDAILVTVNGREDGIATLHREAGDLRANIHQARVEAYQQSIHQGGSVSDSRHAADYAAMHLQRELHVIEGEIAARTAERDAMILEFQFLQTIQ